jgi:hypothetical protein
MSHPVQEQLLGYVMGALDDSEQEQLEESFKTDPRLRRELLLVRQSLQPLRADRGYYRPRPGLAQRTCEFVALQAAAYAQPAAAETKPVTAGRVAMSPAPIPPVWASHVRWPDLAMTVGVWLAAAVLVLPAIQSSRFASQLAACQDNLRKVGIALDNYSQHHQGYFPMVPARGRLAAAGIYAPTLLRGGFLTEARAVLCPSSTLCDQQRFRVPSLDELEQAAEDQLPQLQCAMGGSYGYCLGHMHNARYEGTRNMHRTHFALVADAPSRDRANHQSANHGGRGQNVLFEDGHLKFLTSSKLCDQSDDIFVNDDGLVAAGVHADDAVIGPSDAPPIIYVKAGGGLRQ